MLTAVHEQWEQNLFMTFWTNGVEERGAMRQRSLKAT